MKRGFGAGPRLKTRRPDTGVPPDKPAISGISVTSVTNDSFTITATINPQGLLASAIVRIGETTNYEMAPVVPTGSPLNQTGQITVTITGLIIATTYHFAIEATSSSGTTTSTDRTQATASTPTTHQPIISNLDSILADEGRVPGMIALYADIDPGELITTVQFQYGKTLAYELGTINLSDIPAGLVPVTKAQVFSKLKPGKYHYRWITENSDGLVFSERQSFRIYPGIGLDGVNYDTAFESALAAMNGASFYVDPSSTDTTENGSIAHPYHSWTAFPSLGGNNRYYQKRGTTYNATTGTLRNVDGPCFIGAYGEGEDYAYMTCVSTSISTFITSTNTLLCRDLDIMGYRSGGVGTELGRGIRMSATSIGATMNHWIHNCNVHRFNVAIDSALTNGYFYGMKITHCEIYETFIESIYPTGTTNIEVAYNYMHDANNAWFINEDQNTSRGDNMQLGFGNSLFPTIHMLAYIHHNTFDRTTTGNKFCIIWNEFNNGEVMHVYNNEFICPEYNTYPGHPVSAIYNGLPNQPVDAASINYIYNNLFIGGEFGVRNYARAGTYIHHNTFLRQYTAIATSNGRDQRVYNNNFIDYISVAFGIAAGAQVRSKNNVFNSSVVGSYAYSGQFPAELLESDYNNFSQGRIASSAYLLPEWRSENAGRDVNSEAGDPVFADATNYDFRTPSNSPIKGTGTDVGLTHDFAGVAIVTPFSKGIYQ